VNLDLDALDTLVAVLDCGSLSAAARRQRLSTNAVSQRIARLETQVGARLLARTTRTVRPTEAGARVAERGRAVLAQCRELLADATETTDVRGTVRVGLAPDLARAFDWPRLVRLLDAHPQLRLEVVARAREVDLVAAGLDLAVWAGPLPPRALIVRRLGALEWHLAASPSYVAARGLPRGPADLASHTCLRVLGPKPERSWELLDDDGHVHIASLGGRFESDSGEVLHHALLGGVGIGIRPARELARAVRAHALVRVLSRYRLRPMPVALVAPEGHLQFPRVRVLADYLARVLATATHPGPT
jgi:DNA-binding transcriptional LysR family regulator